MRYLIYNSITGEIIGRAATLEDALEIRYESGIDVIIQGLGD